MNFCKFSYYNKGSYGSLRTRDGIKFKAFWPQIFPWSFGMHHQFNSFSQPLLSQLEGLSSSTRPYNGKKNTPFANFSSFFHFIIFFYLIFLKLFIFLLSFFILLVYYSTFLFSSQIIYSLSQINKFISTIKN